MIGLITFHWADDYGAMLQAYALKHYLEKYEDVKIVPYFPKALQSRYKLIKTDMAYDFKMSLSSMLNVNSFRLRLKRRMNMLYFRKKFLTNEAPFSDAAEIAGYDNRISKFVVGSDQIWNPEITEGLADGYFCTFRDKLSQPCKCIAYAASIGSERLDGKYDEPLRDRLKNLDAISVREAHIAPYISSLCGKGVSTVSDPVFLLDKAEWAEFAGKPKKEKPYILVYYTERNMELINYAKALAEEKGLEIRLFRQEYPEYWSKAVHFMSGSGPRDFLKYMNNAEYVITNSFHGLAFAIIFQKQFAVFAHSDKNARLNMLLSAAALKDRIVSKADDFDIDGEICWDNCEKSFNALKTAAKQFINDEILNN